MPNILTQEQVNIIGGNINTNMKTIIHILQGFQIKEGMKTEDKRANAQIVLLGCIAIALTTMADLQFCQADRASLLVPN